MSTLLRGLIEKVYVSETKKSRLKLIKWMQRKRLLHGKMKCRRCKKRMKMVTSSCKDGYIWQCKKSCGRNRKSIRTKSIFSHSHASLFSWLKYIHRFSQGLRMRQVDMMLDDISNSSATLSKMSMKLRSVCVRSMRRLRKKRGQKVGGLNVCVHIDESKFHHRRKVSLDLSKHI